MLLKLEDNSLMAYYLFTPLCDPHNYLNIKLTTVFSTKLTIQWGRGIFLQHNLEVSN